MSYSSYFFTGVIKSGDKFIGRYDGESWGRSKHGRRLTMR
jgi:hypothetical protein